MKNVIKILLSFVFVATIVACDDAYEVNYDPEVKISFEGVENNIIQVEKGVNSYTAKIKVTAREGMSFFEVYNADAKTGSKISVIEGTSTVFDPVVKEFTYELPITDLTENKCISVYVTNAEDKATESKMVVKITPAVLFSQDITMETADDYYGSYYASWLDGRVYLKSNMGSYAGEVDFSMGMMDLGETEKGEKILSPILVSPAKRAEYNLPTLSGLTDTKYELTSLTKEEYDNISRVDVTPISSLADPTLETIKLENGKVYLFKTASDKKGLIYVSTSNKRTGTIQDGTGKWVEDYTYYRVQLTTKVIAK